MFVIPSISDHCKLTCRLALMYILLLGLSAFLQFEDGHIVWFIIVHHYPWQEYNGNMVQTWQLPYPASTLILSPSRFQSHITPKSLSNSSISTASGDTTIEPNVHSTPLPPPSHLMKKLVGLPPNPSWKSALQSLYPQHLSAPWGML